MLSHDITELVEGVVGHETPGFVSDAAWPVPQPGLIASGALLGVTGFEDQSAWATGHDEMTMLGVVAAGEYQGGGLTLQPGPIPCSRPMRTSRGSIRLGNWMVLEASVGRSFHVHFNIPRKRRMTTK